MKADKKETVPVADSVAEIQTPPTKQKNTETPDGVVTKTPEAENVGKDRPSEKAKAKSEPDPEKPSDLKPDVHEFNGKQFVHWELKDTLKDEEQSFPMVGTKLDLAAVDTIKLPESVFTLYVPKDVKAEFSPLSNSPRELVIRDSGNNLEPVAVFRLQETSDNSKFNSIIQFSWKTSNPQGQRA